MDRKELKYFLPFVVAVVIFIFSIPAANFALNDDPIYYDSVQNFVQNHSLVNNQPYIATLFLQIFYGSLFVYVLGLSHATLMLSMMVMGALVVIATYFLLRMKLNAKFSVLGSLLLLTNPVFYNLTHTFMTDVFALLFMVTSAIFFLKFADKKIYKYLVIGVLLAVAGFWVRQYAVMTVAGLFLYLLLKDRKLLFKPSVILLLILLPLVNIASWAYWFYGVHDQSYVCPYTLSVTSFAKNLPQLFIYAGYFFLPIGILFAFRYKKVLAWMKEPGRFRMLLPILVLVAILAFIFIRYNSGFSINPFDKSLAQPLGVGSNTISGDKAAFIPDFLWAPIIALSFFTAFSIVALYARKLKENLLLILTMLSLAAPMLFFTAFYDRYYLFLIPLSLPILLTALKDFRYAKHVLILGIILMGAWAWYGTYDYLAWNTARWDGINYLLSTGVQPMEIDGGLEYDAQFFNKCTDRSAAVIWHGWGYSVSDKYVVSFSHLSGYETVRNIGYSGPFGERLGSIFLEKKIG